MAGSRSSQIRIRIEIKDSEVVQLLDLIIPFEDGRLSSFNDKKYFHGVAAVGGRFNEYTGKTKIEPGDVMGRTALC